MYKFFKHFFWGGFQIQFMENQKISLNQYKMQHKEVLL